MIYKKANKTVTKKCLIWSKERKTAEQIQEMVIQKI